MNPPSRSEIEKFATERFQADLERRIDEYARKQARALAQVRSRGNVGGHLPALIQCKQERLRAEILALADAWVEAGTICAVALQPWAEEALEKTAAEMAAGTVGALRGEVDLTAMRTRIPRNDTAGSREIESAMKSALREGKLRLKTQRIQFERSLRGVSGSGLQSGSEPPKHSSADGATQPGILSNPGGRSGKRGSKCLRLFLCHASGDMSAVRDLFSRLRTDGFSPWLDEECLLPGQDWDHEIAAAVRSSGAVLVCLSRASVTKEGFVQKEIKYALDVADEKPEGTIFIIPVRLEECVVPERLKRWHWVNLFEERGYKSLLKSLRSRQRSLAGQQ